MSNPFVADAQAVTVASPAGQSHHSYHQPQHQQHAFHQQPQQQQSLTAANDPSHQTFQSWIDLLVEVNSSDEMKLKAIQDISFNLEVRSICLLSRSSFNEILWFVIFFVAVVV